MPIHSRRKFIRNTGFTAAGFMLGPAIPADKIFFSNTQAAYQIQDTLKESSQAQMRGFIGKKLDLSYVNRIMAQSSAELTEPFRHRTETHLWQTEFWGKWLTSAILAYRCRPSQALLLILQNAVKDLIATQSPDGYIGNYKKEYQLEQWDIWGMKYCLLGLLDFYELTGNTESLSAAVKLADYLILEIKSRDGIIVNKGNYRGMAASSVLAAIGRLYIVTNDEKYLAFANEIVTQWETPGGPQLISKAGINVHERFPKPAEWYSWEQGQKAYEMMSCYEGLLELYRITGRAQYKKAVEETWTNIRNTEINIAGSGASAEMWFGGKDLQSIPVFHFQETCVTVTWIRLNQQLLKLTGEAKYADAIEESYYNALLAALGPDGSEWAKYTPLNGERLPGSGQCGMKLNCCNANGPRALFSLPLTAVMSTNMGLSVNFFVDGTYELKTPSDKKMSVELKTDYPATGIIHINLLLDKPEAITLRVRIPAWSQNTRLSVNEITQENIVPGEFAEINRLWSSSDQISLTLDMRGRIIKAGRNGESIALLSGPIVLARDSRLPGTKIGTAITAVVGKTGFVDLQISEMQHEYIWVKYLASFYPESFTENPAAPVEMTFCDYASAGNGHEGSVFQVWMPNLHRPE